MMLLRQCCSVKLKSSKLMVCLSLTTIFLLTVSTVTIVSLISKTPIIILALSQSQSGQVDLSLTSPTNLNNTRIKQLTGLASLPRLEISDVVVNNIHGTGWLMDFKGENENQLGHYGWEIQQDEVFLHESFGVKVGEVVQVAIGGVDGEFSGVMGYLSRRMEEGGFGMTYGEFWDAVGTVRGVWRLMAPFRVVGVFATSMGKFPEGETADYAYFNIKNMMQYMVRYTMSSLNIQNNTQTNINTLISSINLQQFSQTIILNMPNRTDIYSNANFDLISVSVNHFTSTILSQVGIYAVQSQMPILYLMSKMSYFGMFIGVVLKLIVFSLFCLSVLMMYNMMMIGVETRNFDFGMMRTVGLTRARLVMAVLVDSLRYVMLANLVAFPCSVGTLRMVSGIFTRFFGFQYTLTPNFEAIAVASVVGFLVPIAASFIPIKVALGEKIIQSINPIRNKTISIKHQTYIQGRQFPLSRFLFGTLSCSFGFMIIYLLPQSLMDQNIGTLLTIFFSILIGLLLGLVILAYSFHYVLQHFVAYITLFWTNVTEFTLVLKNLSAHRVKNRRAALLYSLSVCFIVFVSVGIGIQIQTIYNQLLKQHSCYLEVSNQNGLGLDRAYYDQILNTPTFSPYLKDYSYSTEPLDDYLRRTQNLQSIQISDKARQFFLDPKIIGVSPNFLKTLYFQNFDVPESRSNQGLDPVEYLYTKEGAGTSIIGQYMAEKLSLEVDGMSEFLVSFNWATSSHRVVMQGSSVFAKSAGVPFSSFMFLPSSICVSLQTYAKLANLRQLSHLPYKSLKLSLFTPSDSTKVANLLRRQLSTSHHYDTIWDYSELTTTITDIESLLTNIFLILLAVVLTISFFSLLTTTTTNILNQSKEISVLLGLGLSKRSITRVYVYEAFVLVLTACVIGMFVGYVLAVTMGLQRELFGDFPVEVDVKGVWVIVAAAVISAVASTLGPIRRMVGRRVAEIMKMV